MADLAAGYFTRARSESRSWRLRLGIILLAALAGLKSALHREWVLLKDYLSLSLTAVP